MEDITWKIIDNYFLQGGNYENVNILVNHQIESYNDFIDKKILQIIQGFNPIQIYHNFNENIKDFTYKIFINVNNPSLSKPIFQSQDGSKQLMTPHLARLNGLTYGVNLYTDIQILVETINSNGIIERNEIKVANVIIGKIPIMVKSKACILNTMPGIAEDNGKNECRYDPGGYFIINGNEKVIISQDRIAENKCLIFSANGSVTDGLTAEIRSVQDGIFLPPKTTSISMSSKPTHLGRIIRINSSFLRVEVPLFIIFRALGIVSDKEIIQHIVFDVDNVKNQKLINELAATIEDASDIYTQEDAITYLTKYIGITGKPKEYLEKPEITRNVIIQIIKNDFLPHVGPNLCRKAAYLGYMVRKLLNTYLGYKKLDNRDSYIHKRIDTPGILLSNLFRQCYGKLMKESRNSIQRELQLWRATPNIPNNIINATNIHRFFKQSVIEMGIRYALATGNWGVKTLGSFQNIRSGVAQVLNRMSYLSTLSHLRRINTPMEKNGKLVQPRKLENTQFGMICLAETPEGAAVGLVKNMALSTKISISMNGQYIREIVENMDTTYIYRDNVKNKYEFLKIMGSNEVVMVQINGDIIGYNTEPVNLYNTMKTMKRKGNIPVTTSIAWDIQSNILMINTEAGRLFRPFLIVDNTENGSKLRLEKLIEENPNFWKEMKDKPFIEFLAFLDKNEEGFIEYLDVEEIDKSMIAISHNELKKTKKGAWIPPKYTHCEINPSLIMGVLACNIPFSDHNQSPRNCYQCLWEEEPVLMEDGSKKKIKDVKVGDKVITFNPTTMETEVTTVINQYVKPTDKTIVEITTYSGRKIITTDDHKYMTNNGWCSPKEFNSTTKVGILQTPLYLEHNVSNPECILTMDHFVDILRKYNVKESLIQKHSQICMKNGLLPLYTNDSRLPIIARMFGYILTDGSINIYNKKHGGQTPQLQACFGTMKDALEFENDVVSLGFNSIVPKEGLRTHPSGAIHHTFDICRNGPLPSLFIALGISFGKKTETYRNEVPSWIMNGSKQVQREFCSGIQGGDGCMIRFNKRKSGYNYICAKTSQQIHPEYKESLIVFMDQIVKMIKKLDIEVSDVTLKQVKTNRVEVSYKIRDTHENLIKYYDVIGYRYSNHKNMNSAVVVEFLKWKEAIVEKRKMKVQKIYEMFSQNVDKQKIMQTFNINYKNYADLYRCYKDSREIRSPYLKDVNMCKWLEMIEVKENTIFMPVTIKLKENCMIADITVSSDYHSFFGGDNFAVHNSAMGKQAVGIYMSNYNNRIDTFGHILNYSQKPLARTKLAKYTNSEAMPSGINTVIAIMTKTGFNQEDSVMINKSALDRGLFTSTYFKSYKDQCLKNHSTGEEEKFTKPPIDTINVKPYNYDNLTSNGFVNKNTYINDGDIIIGKVMPQKINGINMSKDVSIPIKANDNGYIDMNYQGVNNDGYKFCKVRLRKYRKPTVGDKVSSRHGQKGTIGMLYSQEDMPFSKEGITPDIIVNPHAIPSRMTVGQLIECIMGKSSCLLGSLGDATPFNGCDVENIANILETYGMERYGNEILYNGRTGEMIHTEIFMGPTFYQRLKHMVADKMHGRGNNGPVVMITRQPAEGRARNGGLRFGEMERDAIVAHGAGCFLKERMLDVSDNYRVFVCKKCGLFCTANPNRNIYKCNICKNQSDIVQIRTPYCAKLLIQELMSIDI